MELNKMNKKTIIVVAVLAILLTLSIIISILGGEKDKNLENLEDTESNITDTTAPKADFAHRYIFANDAANVDFTGMFESICDESECTVKLVRFERSGNLGIMDEKVLKSLTDEINTIATEEELKSIGSEEIPTEEGIYRTVMEIMDAHGNAAYEEIVLILDKTGAKIEEVVDKVVMVSKENISAEPAIDKSEYQIIDNVDGKIKADDIVCELELRDADKHEWLVHVSYVDRAGNESKATFLIIVQEAKNETEATPKPGASGNGGSNMSNINTGNDGAENSGGTTNSGNNNNADTANNGENTDNSSSSDKENTSQNKPTYSGQYNIELIPQEDGSFYVNTSGDEWKKTPEWEDENHISPYEQAVIDAGYGNIVDFGDGEYAVLMKNSEHTIDGKKGGDILREYLAKLDLEPGSVTGGWIDDTNGWYWYTAKNMRELITEDDEGYWDY